MREFWKVRPSLAWPGLRASAPGVALVAVAASLATAPDAGGVLVAALALIVITIAVIDARHFLIPDELNVVAFALGLAHAGLADDSAMEAIALAALRGAALAFAFLTLRAIYLSLRGRQGIGLGDVKLAAVAGAWLDWQMMPIAINIAAFMALATYTTRQLALRRSIKSTDRLPFGLFLAPAIWVTFILNRWLMAAP